MVSLPKKLNTIRDQVIDHVRKNTPEPKNLGDLVSWFEDEGWDEILSGWGSEHVALKLDYLASLEFEDYEMISREDIDEPLTDELRIDYARRSVFDAFEEGDGYLCPSVHAVEIKKPNGDSAVLGWVVEIHGQGGPVAEFHGAFADKENFYQHLKKTDFLLDSDQDTLTDEAILRLWRHPPKPIRSIVVQVEWGYEVYECPMSPRTWKRIVQGKPVRRVETYKYEGRNYRAEWLFNSDALGTLVVNYSDGDDGDGVGFEGDLSEALIRDDGQETSWTNELIKHGLKAPLTKGKHL